MTPKQIAIKDVLKPDQTELARYGQRHATYHDRVHRLSMALDKMGIPYADLENFDDASLLILISHVCICYDRGLNIKRAVDAVRERFTGPILVIAVAGDEHYIAPPGCSDEPDIDGYKDVTALLKPHAHEVVTKARNMLTTYRDAH